MLSTASIVLALAFAAAGQPPTNWVRGEGLVIYFERKSGEPPATTFHFMIHHENAETPDIRAGVTAAAKELESFRIHSSHTFSVLSVADGGNRVLSIVDADAGNVLYQASCSRVKLTADAKRYLCESSDGKLVTYDLSARMARPALRATEGATAVLRFGSLPARRQFLQTFNSSKSLRGNASIRAEIVDALNRELADDLRRAREQVSSDGLRAGSAQRDYFGELITAAANTGDVSCLPAIVRADHPSVIGGMARFGMAAVTEALASAADPIPVGYSRYYRSYVIRGLTQALRPAPNLAPAERVGVTKLVLTSVSKPSSLDEMLASIELAGELDDDSLDGVIQRLAYEPQYVEAAGLSRASEVAEVQSKARAVLSSRISIR